MLDFILSIQPQAQKMIFGQPWDIFLPPLFGSLFGVLLGFFVNYLYKWFDSKRSRLHYIKSINKELDQILCNLKNNNSKNIFIDPLKGDPPLALPSDIWVSALTQGALRHFRLTEAECLCKIYSHISNYNNDVVIYINILTTYFSAVGNDIPENSMFYLPRKRLLESNEYLISKISDIKATSWMLSKHWWNFYID